MNKINSFFIFFLCLFILPKLWSQNKVFRAGASQIDITPSIGTKIYGNWIQPSAKLIHDPLNVKALALDDGDNIIVLVVADLVEINKRIIDIAKEIVAKETPLQVTNILISATHTHSGPSAQGDEYIKKSQPLNDYSMFLARKFADSIITAYHNLEPAKIAWGSVDIPEHVFVRRWLMKDSVYSPYGNREIVRMNPGFKNPALLKPSGPIDPELSFISVQSLNNRPISVFANYSLHYVGGVPEDEISADYFSLFGQYLDRMLTPEVITPKFVGIMSNGTSGNVNNLNFNKPPENWAPYEKMNMVARDIASKVFKKIQTLEYKNWVPLGVKQKEMTLKVRKATPTDMTNIARVNSRPDSISHYYSKWEKMYAKRILTMEVTWPDKIDIILQAFKIGNLGIVALPFEAFTQTGLEVKSKSPFDDTFTIALANGCLNYLPTPKEIDLGGYETWLSINRVEKEASVKISSELLSLLESFINN